MTATLDQVLAAITTVSRKLDVLMSQQSEIDADVQAIDQADTDLAAAVTAIQADIADLNAKIAAGQPVSLTALDAKVASLKTMVATVAAIAPPPAAPPAG